MFCRKEIKIMANNNFNNFNPYYSNNPYNNYINRNNYIPSQQMQLPQQQQQVSQNNIVWVKGKENARSMQLPPNSTVILLDSEVGKFYIKTTDDIGLGKLRIFSYSEQPDITEKNDLNINQNFEVDLSNYVTKQQLEKVVKEIKENEQFVLANKSNSKQQNSKFNKEF